MTNDNPTSEFLGKNPRITEVLIINLTRESVSLFCVYSYLMDIDMLRYKAELINKNKEWFETADDIQSTLTILHIFLEPLSTVRPELHCL